MNALNTIAISATRSHATDLLQQCTKVANCLRDIADAFAHLDTTATPDRHIDRGHGIDL